MASSTMSTAGLAGSETVQSIFITGVKNAHALEKQALQLMQRQVERLENYPEVRQMLERHIAETQQQEERIDQILHELGEDRSLLKDWATQLMGNVAAIQHAMMADEILKNTFANQAFENFEIASYRSLIVMAEAAGHSQFVPSLRKSLEEEERMAQWVASNVEKITRMYLEHEARGEQANR